MKHTRVVHHLNAGYSDSEVMNITGYEDTPSFDKYKRDQLGNIKTRLIGKTTEFYSFSLGGQARRFGSR
jgi:hypothetical protein